MGASTPIQEGWSADPTGRYELRYHDGARWTDHVSNAGQQGTDPFAGGGAPPPPKPKKNRTWLKVLVGMCVLGLVFVGGCVALIGTAANQVSKSLDAEQKAHAITPAQFKALTIGMTEREVATSLGKKPEDRQEFESEGILTKEPQNSSCIYYNRSGGSFGDSYQLCFDDRRLSAKNAY